MAFAVGAVAGVMATQSVENLIRKETPVKYPVQLAWNIPASVPGFEMKGVKVYRKMAAKDEIFVHGKYTDYMPSDTGQPFTKIASLVNGTNYVDIGPKLRGKTYAYTTTTVAVCTNGATISEDHTNEEVLESRFSDIVLQKIPSN